MWSTNVTVKIVKLRKLSKLAVGGRNSNSEYFPRKTKQRKKNEKYLGGAVCVCVSASLIVPTSHSNSRSATAGGSFGSKYYKYLPDSLTASEIVQVFSRYSGSGETWPSSNSDNNSSDGERNGQQVSVNEQWEGWVLSCIRFLHDTDIHDQVMEKGINVCSTQERKHLLRKMCECFAGQKLRLLMDKPRTASDLYLTCCALNRAEKRFTHD